MLKGLKSPNKISLPEMRLNALMCLDRIGILEGLRKESTTSMPPVCNWPLSLWNQPPNPPVFFRSQFPSLAQWETWLGRLPWGSPTVARWKICELPCLFQCLPASVPVLARNIAIIELAHTLSQMTPPTQNSGKWKKACCKAESYSLQSIHPERELAVFSP